MLRPDVRLASTSSSSRQGAAREGILSETRRLKRTWAPRGRVCERAGDWRLVRTPAWPSWARARSGAVQSPVGRVAAAGCESERWRRGCGGCWPGALRVLTGPRGAARGVREGLGYGWGEVRGGQTDSRVVRSW
jgi:hypothetical protein